MSIIVDSGEENSVKIEETLKQDTTLEKTNMECEKEFSEKKKKYVVYSVPIVIKKRIRVLLTCRKDNCEDDDHHHLNPEGCIESTLSNTEIDYDDQFGVECSAAYETRQDAIDDKKYGNPDYFF